MCLRKRPWITCELAIGFYARQFNIKRVVLPRVLSLPQRRRIIERVSVEVEVLDLGRVEPVRQAQVTQCAVFARNLRPGCFKRAAWLAHSLYLRENPAHWTSIPACNQHGLARRPGRGHYLDGSLPGRMFTIACHCYIVAPEVVWMNAATESPAQAQIIASLRDLGLVRAGEPVSMAPLTGGVSSDIWRVDLAQGRVCVKRALPQLKVEAQWEVPVERNAYECAWIDTVARIYPHAVPKIIAHDANAGLFVMEYLDPAKYPVWKAQLRKGQADPALAARVGTSVAGIHRATADDHKLAKQFATDSFFYALRLESYLVATARRHPELAAELQELVQATAQTKRTLVHGDISPKNILVGPQGPVFLDAECAWYGDPAFDLAFCLNHLLLKCVWVPRAARAFLTCFTAMAAAYRAAVTWEAKDELEARAAHLLPGLMLARVDGKSPVEYLTKERDKERVRRVARALLIDPRARLEQVRAAWVKELGL